MTDNLRIWSAVKTPPPHALKTINGGRLNGMTDIDPMWRYEEMTKLFGPIGTGWKVDMVERWQQEVGGEILVFVQVAVYYRLDAQGVAQLYPAEGSGWSAPVYGLGGSKVASQEKSGIHANDEAWKMATTDATSTALKMLGFGAEVYAGRMDGSKHPTAPKAASAPRTAPAAQQAQRPDPQAKREAQALAASGDGYGDDPPCPECNGKMWDNREPERGGRGKFPKNKPSHPDFRCRDKDCDGVLWPPKGAMTGAPAHKADAQGWPTGPDDPPPPDFDEVSY